MTNSAGSNPRRANAPKRGGLGRGLGALIPDGHTEDITNQERPLDVLLPDLQNNGRAEGSVRKVRGGSARELLGPRVPKSSDGVSAESAVPRKSTDVSRETISLSSEVTKPAVTDTTVHLVDVPDTTFGMLPTSWIIPNTRQPRQVFEQTDLEELAGSLREVGLLQPIVVRRIDTTPPVSEVVLAAIDEHPEARYELIMGERRLRAAKLAGLEELPALVRTTGDEDLLRDALLENLHRVQLNPLEEAAAYAQLMEDFSCTQEYLANKISKSRSQIANTLRLLNLPPEVQKHVSEGFLSAGHARALLSLTALEQMSMVAKKIISEGLSVRATEQLVRKMKQVDRQGISGPRSIREPSPLAMNVMSLVSELFDAKVSVTEGKKRGRIIIDYSDPADLERIAGVLRESRGQDQ